MNLIAWMQDALAVTSDPSDSVAWKRFRRSPESVAQHLQEHERLRARLAEVERTLESVGPLVYHEHINSTTGEGYGRTFNPNDWQAHLQTLLGSERCRHDTTKRELATVREVVEVAEFVAEQLPRIPLEKFHPDLNSNAVSSLRDVLKRLDAARQRTQDEGSGE